MVTGYTHLYPYHMHLILAMARGFGMQKKANLWESSSSSCIGITHINQAWVTGLHRAPCIFSSVPLIHTTPACCKVLAYLCSSSHSMRTLLEMFDARPGKQQQTRIDLAWWTHTHTHSEALPHIQPMRPQNTALNHGLEATCCNIDLIQNPTSVTGKKVVMTTGSKFGKKIGSTLKDKPISSTMQRIGLVMPYWCYHFMASWLHQMMPLCFLVSTQQY